MDKNLIVSLVVEYIKKEGSISARNHATLERIAERAGIKFVRNNPKSEYAARSKVMRVIRGCDKFAMHYERRAEIGKYVKVYRLKTL